MDNSFKETLNDYENRTSVTSEFIPHNEKEYSVKCKIVENNQILFDLEVYAGSIEQAKLISEKCRKTIP